MLTKPRTSWGIAAIAFATGLFVFALPRGQSDDVASDADPVPVTVEPVTARDVQRLVTMVGSLVGYEEVPISTEVDGKIVRIHHDVGDTVHPGELLMEIDPVSYTLAVEEAERSLELELARLGLTEPPENPDSFDIKQLPNVVRAATQWDQSKRDHQRAAQLWERKAIAIEDWDLAETNLKLAEAGYRQSLNDARVSIASMRRQQVMLRSARQRLDDTKVTVPDQTGIERKEGERLAYLVAERNVTEGESLVKMRSSGPAFRLVIADRLKLQAAIAERHANEIRVGQMAGLKSEATGEKIFYGKVIRVNPTVDRASRTFRVEIEFPNDSGELPPGSFARAAIQTRVDKDALTVPAESIVRFAGVVKVFVVREGKAVAVPVELGERIEQGEGDEMDVWQEVRGEIHADEPVVTTGHSQLADGRSVRIKSNPPADEESP